MSAGTADEELLFIYEHLRGVYEHKYIYKLLTRKNSKITTTTPYGIEYSGFDETTILEKSLVVQHI